MNTTQPKLTGWDIFTGLSVVGFFLAGGFFPQLTFTFGLLSLIAVAGGQHNPDCPLCEARRKQSIRESGASII